MDSNHDFRPEGLNKNLIIAVLLIIIAVQAGFLLSGGKHTPDESEATSDTVAVGASYLDAANRRELLINFDAPLNVNRTDGPIKPAPATIQPELDGTWNLVNPYCLRFSAAVPFKLKSSYDVTLNPDILLGDGRTFADPVVPVRTGGFDVQEITLSTRPSPDGKTMVAVTGNIKFNIPVDPETLLKHLTLTDPDSPDGKPIPLSVGSRYAQRSFYFTSAPVEKTFTSRELTLTVNSDLTPHDGNLKLGKDASKKITLFLSPDITVKKLSAEPGMERSRIFLDISTPMDPETALASLTVTPETDFSTAADGAQLILSGPFKPGKTYRVTLAQGAEAVDGATLPETFSHTVLIPDLPSSVEFASPGMFLSSKGSRKLILKSMNTDRVRITVDKVWMNNIFPLFAEWAWRMDSSSYAMDEVPSRLGDRLSDKLIDVPHKPNAMGETVFSLSKWVPKNTPGFYKIGAGLPDNYEGDQRWLLVTDIGLVAKRVKNNLLVFSASFNNAAPLSGVRITLISGQNQVLAEGRTDASGQARLTYRERTDMGSPFMILARKGKDMSFLVFDRSGADTAGLDTGGRTLSSEGYTTFLYGERDIYRPGETVEGMAVIRDARLNPPSPMPLRLKTVDPTGRDLGTMRINSNAQGFATFRVPIPDYALTGTYTFELLAGDEAIGHYRCQVEEFVPDRISVDIRPTAEDVRPGDELSWNVISRYLFGPPASNLPVETHVRLRSAPFTPKGYDDYVFGDPDKEFKSMEIYQDENTLDENGEHTFSCTLPGELAPPAALTADLIARVSEQGGRGVTAYKGVTVHAYPAYPGLKALDRQGFDPGKPVTLDYVVLAPDGTPATHSGLKAELYKDRWQTVVRAMPDGSVRWETVRDPKLASSQTVPAGRTKGSFTFTPPSYGSWRVVLSDPNTGASSSVSFYTGGWGYSPWALENPARIDLVPDKNEYKPGEIAQIQVRAPFSGRLLITVEGDQIFRSEVLALKGNTASVSVPIKKAYAPNIYVSATLVRGAADLEPGTTARALGTVSLNVDRLANDLHPAVEAPEVMRPERKLTVRARTAPGATATLAIVDEGILQLIAQKTPDPFQYFYAKRALGVSWYDIFAMLLPEVDLRGTSPAGGGAGLDGAAQYMGTEPMRRKKPVAFWSGPLTADKDGYVEYSVDVPDFQGGLRVMCVVQDGRKFGASQAMVRVRSPLSVTPTFPRFLAMNESMLVPLTVRNDTPEDGEFSVELTAEGPVEVLENKRTLTIKQGRQETAWFTLHTFDREGTVRFTASAQGNTEQYKTSDEAALRSALPREHTVLSGSLNSTETVFPVDLPVRIVPSTLERGLRIGRLPMIRFSGNLRSLLHYPYGCMEQTVSQAFPLLYFNTLAQTLDPELFSGTTPASMIRKAVAKLRSAQLMDGGFPLWASGTEAQPWTSVYATHFLVEAKIAGYQVGDSLLSQALDYCRMKSGDFTYNQSESVHSVMLLATYAQYVLARAGQAATGNMDLVRDRGLQNTPPDGRALLAAAYAAIGDTASFRKVQGTLTDITETTHSTGGDFNSPVRARALMLLALMDAAPDDPLVPTLVSRLIDGLSGGYIPSTQENSFALTALGRFFARQDLAGPFAGTVSLGNEVIGSFDQDTTLVLPNVEGDKPLTVAFKQGFQSGKVFYSLHTRYVPVKEDYHPAENGISVWQDFWDRDGAELDINTLKQGDLIAMRTCAISHTGPVDNVVVVSLLAPGLEVENPRLSSRETLPWMKNRQMEAAYTDLRNDRILLFTDLPNDEWVVSYAMLRAVNAGNYTLPPVRAEAMYYPALFANTGPGNLTVVRPQDVASTQVQEDAGNATQGETP